MPRLSRLTGGGWRGGFLLPGEHCYEEPLQFGSNKILLLIRFNWGGSCKKLGILLCFFIRLILICIYVERQDLGLDTQQLEERWSQNVDGCEKWIG